VRAASSATAVTLDARTVLEKNVRLGTNVSVGIGTILGGDPQDLKFKGEETWVEIGDGTRIREYSTINRGTLSRSRRAWGRDASSCRTCTSRTTVTWATA
jgi:UDP-N-acetylglucosamine acyltransferase